MKIFRSIFHYFSGCVIWMKSAPFTLFFLLQRLFFHRKILVFDSQDKLFIQFFSPVIDLIERDPKYRNVSIYFTSNEKSSLSYIKSIATLLSFRNGIFIQNELFKYAYGYDLYITAHFYSQVKDPTRSVLIQHNLPVKYLYPPLKFIRNSRIQFITGELHMKQFKDAITHYHIDPDLFSIYEIGFPKLDNVLSDKIQKTELLKLRNLSLSKKTILYAPSWDEGLSLKRFGKQIINTLVKLSDEFNIIIRPHPVLLTREGSGEFELYTGGIDWLTLLNKYKNVNNLYISTDLDSNFDLVCADLLISDVSSITWDFLLLGKPVLLFSSDEYFSKINPTLYHEYGNANLSLDELKNNELINGGRKYAVLFNNLEELELKVYEILNNLDRFQIDQMSLRHQLVYNPGHAAPRFLDVISKYLFGPVEDS